jgi:4-diphosphocytidyl-2-C-methyl-D-erythritol kinase
MIVFPNAKINLGLNIINRREDGYHNIETVFYPVPLCDILEITLSENGETTFKQTGIIIDSSSENNLIIKALRLFQSDFDLPALNICLRKQIPLGAGLGGGSADAAFMLKLLNDFSKAGLTEAQLEDAAAKLGADCPFFIRNQPVFAEGIGNIFMPLYFSLKDCFFVIVKPDVNVSTREAYAHIRPHKPQYSIREIIIKPVSEWKGRLVNDFEEGVFALYPEIDKIKQELYCAGAIYASMSGSGSSVFGIFQNNKLSSLKSAVDKSTIFRKSSSFIILIPNDLAFPNFAGPILSPARI